MKFFLNFLLFTILSNAGELDESGQEASLDSGGYEKYLDDSTLNDLTGESEGGQESETADNELEAESVDGQANEATEDETPESVLDSFEENSETGDESADLLNLVNDLGLVHSGLPFEIDSKEQLVEYLQKAHDYTQKTQAIAEDRKSFEAEMTTKREAFEKEQAQFKEELSSQQDAIYSYQIISNVFEGLRTQDPELYEDLVQLCAQENQRFRSAGHNPHVEKLEGKVKSLEEKLADQGKQKETEEHEAIREQWNNGLQEVQKTYAGTLRKLGVKPDWSKVQEAWSADTTGKMTVKSALLAVYGESIMKANEAHRKMLAARKAPVSDEVQVDGPELEKAQKGYDPTNNHSRMSYLQKIASKYTG